MAAIGKGNSDGAAQMQHFVQQDGLNTFRLPVTWQFLINSNSLNGTAVDVSGSGTLPMSDGQLNQANTAQYNELVQGCLATGAYCIVDIHNYARFEGQVIGQGGPTDAQFAGLWSQVATMYKNESKVIFGVMNEPHDIPNLSMWADTVQAAVTAIRMAGATTQVCISSLSSNFSYNIKYCHTKIILPFLLNGLSQQFYSLASEIRSLVADSRCSIVDDSPTWDRFHGCADICLEWQCRKSQSGA